MNNITRLDSSVNVCVDKLTRFLVCKIWFVIRRTVIPMWDVCRESVDFWCFIFLFCRKDPINLRNIPFMNQNLNSIDPSFF